MKIDVRANDCVYITINGHIYYIDDSTGEQIMERWSEDEEGKDEVGVVSHP
jgi:outer membrane protein assembly factor BamB